MAAGATALTGFALYQTGLTTGVEWVSHPDSDHYE